MLLASVSIGALAAISVILLSRRRRFYFVRHGETLLNAQHIRQGEEGARSENGRKQAEKVGIVLGQVSAERIISSTYPRARETAEIINAHLKTRIMYSDLLIERRNPSEIIGRNRDEPEVMHIVD